LVIGFDADHHHKYDWIHYVNLGDYSLYDKLSLPDSIDVFSLVKAVIYFNDFMPKMMDNDYHRYFEHIFWAWIWRKLY
jgi:hypothetical protein